MFAEHVLNFYKSLSIDTKLPRGATVLNPYRDKKTFALCEQFYRKYYSDNRERAIILGINPGRHGAGLTGIPFMDPVKLVTICGIENDLPKKAELSADFIHSMIHAYGGVEKFFGDFYINSVSPLGFTMDGKNANYYDTPALQKALDPFILQTLQKQLTFGITRRVAFCLGEGDNYKYLEKLNERGKLFSEIIPLPHPRFIMQYRRKRVDEYIAVYLERLGNSKK